MQRLRSSDLHPRIDRSSPGALDGKRRSYVANDKLDNFMICHCNEVAHASGRGMAA